MTAVPIQNASLAVTGGCGFIGAAVVQRLLDDGAGRVLVLDSLKAGRREKLVFLSSLDAQGRMSGPPVVESTERQGREIMLKVHRLFRF